jgi:hypothetical protein
MYTNHNMSKGCGVMTTVHNSATNRWAVATTVHNSPTNKGEVTSMVDNNSGVNSITEWHLEGIDLYVIKYVINLQTVYK